MRRHALVVLLAVLAGSSLAHAAPASKALKPGGLVRRSGPFRPLANKLPRGLAKRLSPWRDVVAPTELAEEAEQLIGKRVEIEAIHDARVLLPATTKRVKVRTYFRHKDTFELSLTARPGYLPEHLTYAAELTFPDQPARYDGSARTYFSATGRRFTGFHRTGSLSLKGLVIEVDRASNSISVQKRDGSVEEIQGVATPGMTYLVRQL
jgi:hypothetical protein